MENTPHWRETPAPEARATALRLEKDVHIVAGRAIKSTHLKERADDVARTPGALLIVQLEMSHSAGLVMQCRAQNPDAKAIEISPTNFPSWGELRPSHELPQWAL